MLSCLTTRKSSNTRIVSYRIVLCPTHYDSFGSRPAPRGSRHASHIPKIEMMRRSRESIWLSLYRIEGTTRPSRLLIHSSRRVERTRTRTRTHTHPYNPRLMAKRRTVIDSDDEQDDGKGAGPSSPKRTRLENKHQAEHRSSKSKGKGKARDDSDILNDFRVDDDDDIAAIRDARAEEDDGAQERFEEEHEESVRESIRQRNRQQGVGFHPMLGLSALKLAFGRVLQNLASSKPLKCTISCATSS
jgi:hypothetical protein